MVVDGITGPRGLHAQPRVAGEHRTATGKSGVMIHRTVKALNHVRHLTWGGRGKLATLNASMVEHFTHIPVITDTVAVPLER